MSKLLGGIQIAAGLMMLALSGLCGAMFVTDLSGNPETLLNPLIWIVVLIFVGSLAATRQGWQRIRGTYVKKRSRASRWASAIFAVLFGLGWIAFQGMPLIGLAGLELDSGIRMLLISRLLPGVVALLVGLFQIVRLLVTRDKFRLHFTSDEA